MPGHERDHLIFMNSIITDYLRARSRECVRETRIETTRDAWNLENLGDPFGMLSQILLPQARQSAAYLHLGPSADRWHLFQVNKDSSSGTHLACNLFTVHRTGNEPKQLTVPHLPVLMLQRSTLQS